MILRCLDPYCWCGIQVEGLGLGVWAGLSPKAGADFARLFSKINRRRKPTKCLGGVSLWKP